MGQESRVSLKHWKYCLLATASVGRTDQRSGRRDGAIFISPIRLVSKRNYYSRSKGPFELHARGVGDGVHEQHEHVTVQLVVAQPELVVAEALTEPDDLDKLWGRAPLPHADAPAEQLARIRCWVQFCVH